MVEEALHYAKRGWYVLPHYGITEDKACECLDKACRTPGKHPRLDRKAATRNTDTITAWWTLYPNSNIAIATGAQSGLIVLDVDVRNDGLTSLTRLERRFPQFITVTAKSGGGGLHFYFKHPNNGEVRNRIGLWPGIDVKADGGLITAPPSRHVSGFLYEWREANHPDRMQPAPIPRWLLSTIQTGKNLGTRRKSKRLAAAWVF